MTNAVATESVAVATESVQSTVRSVKYVPRTGGAPTTVGQCADSIAEIVSVLNTTPAGRAVLACTTTTAEMMAARKLDDDEMQFYGELVELRALKATLEAQAATTAKYSLRLSKAQFLAKAVAVGILVDGGKTADGKPLVAKPKEFSTGSFGWGINGKVEIMVDGTPVKCQFSGNLVAVNSKDS